MSNPIKRMSGTMAGGADHTASYEAELDISSGLESEALIIPRGVSEIVVTVSGSEGFSCKVQTTTDSVEKVEEGLPLWESWVHGLVSGVKSGVCKRVTAIRLVREGDSYCRVTIVC